MLGEIEVSWPRWPRKQVGVFIQPFIYTSEAIVLCTVLLRSVPWDVADEQKVVCGRQAYPGNIDGTTDVVTRSHWSQFRPQTEMLYLYQFKEYFVGMIDSPLHEFCRFGTLPIINRTLSSACTNLNPHLSVQATIFHISRFQSVFPRPCQTLHFVICGHQSGRASWNDGFCISFRGDGSGWRVVHQFQIAEKFIDVAHLFSVKMLARCL